jgi:chromosome segregation protein
LAPYAENIIIDNCQQAQEAIDFLKTDDLGWANFLPISNFNHTQVKIDESIKENSLGLLSEYIETDPVYRPIVEFLLKDIYCVESKSQAQKLLQITSNPEIKFITKKGQVLSKYQISGGNYARKEETSLIGRDVKIEKLGKNCQELNTKISCLKDDLQQKSSAAESLSAKIEAAKQDIHNLQIKKANIQSEINSADEELSRINKEVILLDSEIDEAQTQKEDLINKKQNRQKELDEVKQQNVKIQNVITSNQESIEEKSQGVQQTLVEITELKTELSSIDEFYSNKKQTYSMLEGNIQETEDNIDNIKQDYAQSEERIGFLHEEIEKLNNKNESLKSECEELEQRIQKISKQKQQVMADMQQTEQHLRSKQSELSDSRQTLHTYEVRNTEYSLKLDNIKDRIYSNYKVKLDEADIEEDKQIDWQKTDAEIDCLRKKVESMADVNLAAFDEHKQLKERFEFLNNQRQDLEEAKESLYKAIKKINRTTTKLFKETFDQIKVTFEEFFKMLFGGGYAHLKLVDENHVLESGIEITARPPGKKPQSISLLSGGEKALTAVALLFAVFKVKPSPFCVLDEIDAPLDESNVDRFAKVLKDFVKTSQFIIITHNKKTIGMADVMYGITMEESGVSKLVSVKFIEEKEKDAQSASI